jgi:hypothetical protein
MRSIRPALTALSLAALLVLSGCGNNTLKETAAKSDGGSSTGVQKAKGYPNQTMSACDILSREVATSLLGSVGQDSPPVPGTNSADVNVSSCVRANAVATLDQARSVSLLMRIAMTPTGARTNASAFSPGSVPGGAQDVLGIGQQAFWNPALGQLNILKDGNWYIVSSGPIDPRKHTLADSAKLAKAIIDKL